MTAIAAWLAAYPRGAYNAALQLPAWFSLELSRQTEIDGRENPNDGWRAWLNSHGSFGTWKADISLDPADIEGILSKHGARQPASA